MNNQQPADLSGVDIGKVMSATGPIVKAVLLRCQPESNTDDQKISAKDSAPSTTNSTTTKEGGDSDDDESISPEQAAEIRLSTKSLISQITIDTTPKKSMVSNILGGPFTFLGQYEEEGIMVMIRRPDWETEEDDSDPNNDNDNDNTNNTEEEKGADGLPKLGCPLKNIPQINPHKLQPPLSHVEVRGDILLMRVAETEEELDEKELDIDSSKEALSPTKKDSEEKVEEIEEDVQKQVSVPSNDDFFLDYTKDEYLKFISRTDIEEVDESSDEEDEDESDGEEGGGLAALLGVGNEEDEEGDEDEDFDPDEDESVGMMNLILGHLLKKFREENGRGPDSLELLEMRKALADKLGVEVPEVDEEKLTAPVPKSPNRKKVVVDEKKNETSPIPARDEEEDGKLVAADLDSLKRSAVDDNDDAESNKKAKVAE